MDEIRRTFLDTTAVAIQLLSAPEVAARWDEPSALEEFRPASSNDSRPSPPPES